MKTFIFTEKKVTINRMYGGSKVVVKIYQLKNNKPVCLGETTYHTSATMGATSEVNAFLINGKHIPASWSKTRSQVTDCDDMFKTKYYQEWTQDKYRIYEV